MYWRDEIKDNETGSDTYPIYENWEEHTHFVKWVCSTEPGLCPLAKPHRIVLSTRMSHSTFPFPGRWQGIKHRHINNLGFYTQSLQSRDPRSNCTFVHYTFVSCVGSIWSVVSMLATLMQSIPRDQRCVCQHDRWFGLRFGVRMCFFR